MKQKKILILNGPNLNMLGIREASIYGEMDLLALQSELINTIQNVDVDLEFFQTNSEGKMLETIHQAYQKINYIIINPGAWTHTSIALRDALLAVDIPFIEVHISNVYRREVFRHHSYLRDIAQAVICGMGLQGYKFALEFAIQSLKN